MTAPSKRSKEDGPPLVVFRLLCPSARTGSIIGKVQAPSSSVSAIVQRLHHHCQSKAALAARHPACSEAEQPAHAWSSLLLSWDFTQQRGSRTQSTDGLHAKALKPLQPLVRCLPAAPCHIVAAGWRHHSPAQS